ncbi:hypothetical protein WPS_10200 [Vulcanimicrobium alpinum]|uniref:Uncharacterized protein n=1 Tax=Vulcanimicrobium alpinum TaxID=3016050 RepID=A0AAN2C8Y0_UNVUL|nr:hypothetical protein WPS_10200 [Vulcanimicrobium alpinum]
MLEAPRRSGKADHPFATDRADLDLVAVFHAGDDRQTALQRKVHVFGSVKTRIRVGLRRLREILETGTDRLR